MKNYNLLSTLVLGIVLLGTWGCAKDQTVAEFDSAQAAKDAAQEAPAVTKTAGSGSSDRPWVGTLKDSDGSTVGMIQLSLETIFVSVPASDNTSTQQAILSGQIELVNVPNSEAEIASATFTPDSDNPNSGALTATINVKDASGNPQTLNLTGTITNGATMTGDIQVIGDSTVLTFNATKGAAANSQILVITSKRAQFQNELNFKTPHPITGSSNLFCTFDNPPPGRDAPAKGIVPTPSPSQGATCEENVQMSIIEDNPVSGVNFYNVFTDQPTVQVDFAYYNIASANDPIVSADNTFPGSHLQFSSVTWDLASHVLSSSNDSANGTSRLVCSATAQGWDCTVTNLGVVTQISFVPGQVLSDVSGAGNH